MKSMPDVMTEQDRKRLKNAFITYLPLPADLESHLTESLTRVLQNPGSLIRPKIVLELSRAYGLPEGNAIGLATALEYFHTASLLFDDLPAMDDALERRGAPCIHREFGDAGAILTALALINRAYALTWQAVTSSNLQHQHEALLYIERYLGVTGLLNGQSMDLHYAALPHDLKTTETIARSKTVSLIRLAFVLPAILGGVLNSERRTLERIALFWGLSYQIVDDLKDILQNTAETGKTVYRDISLGRPNIALVIGIDNSISRLTRLIHIDDRMFRRLMKVRPDIRFLETLRDELGKEASRLTREYTMMPLGA